MYNINCLKLILGNNLCSQLLFVHVFTGCDATSGIFGVGKKATFQKLAKDDQTLHPCSKEFIPHVIQQLPLKLLAEKQWPSCLVGRTLNHLNLCTTACSLRKYLQSSHLSHQNDFLLLQHSQSFIASESTTS